LTEQARSAIPVAMVAECPTEAASAGGATHLRLIEPSREPGLQAQA